MKEASEEKCHYFFAAITFTNKAAKEITERLKQKSRTSNIFVGTIDGFIEKEIIGNFVHIIFPNLPSFQYSYQNNHKFDSFSEGCIQISKKNIFGTYSFNKQKEGNNFKCEFALNILKKSKLARDYMQCKYKKILIDEYQDCDGSMNELFQFLKNELNIKLFIVGDIKQSIYQWRGASPEYLNNLADGGDYSVFRLTENFRSKQSIVDFSQAISTDYIIDNIVDEKAIYYLNPSEFEYIEDVVEYLISNGYINLNNNIQILIGINEDINNLHSELENLYPNQFKYIQRNDISNCQNSYILEQIATYYFDKNYTEFHVLESISIDYNRKTARELKMKLDILRENLNQNTVEEIFNYLGVSIFSYGDKLETEILFDVLLNPLNEVFYLPENKDSKYIMTTFTAKGLEADVVIIFTSYYFDKRSKKMKIEDNYVGVTRARSKLILIDDGIYTYKDKINDLLDKNNNGIYSFDDFVETIN